VKRRRVSEEQLLKEIRGNVEPATSKIAKRILDFAEAEGAVPVPRHNSISMRFRPLDREERQWLTPFVVTTAGTFYCGWLYRWHEEGFPKTMGLEYQKELESALGREVVHGPSASRTAVPLEEIDQKWLHVTKTIRLTSRQLRGTEKPSPTPKVGLKISAIEGLATEVKMTRFGRDRGLRNSAMAHSNGVCVVCRQDFKKVLGGRGVCVPHVHHLKQRSSRDKPTTTRLKDLVVVCANCHMLLHFVDHGRPL